MRKIKYLLLILISFISLQSLAQNGYSISIDVVGAKDKLMTLSYCKGSLSQRFVSDSIMIKGEQQKITFHEDDRIISGIYQIGFKDDPKNTINIVVDNGAKLHFTLNGTTLLLLKPQDQLNKDFILLQTATTSIDDKKKRLDALVKKYPQSSVSLFAQLELKKAGADLANNDADKKKLRDTYFKGIDLQDKRMPLMPNAYSYLLNYMTLLPINNENYQDNVDLLLKGQDCNSRNYNFYLDWIYKNLTYYQQYDLSTSFRYIYSMYLDKDSCKAKNPKFYDKITKALKELDELPIGSVIPAFDMEDATGKIYSIQGIYPDSKYTFLAFYDPNCSHCKEVMPKVEAYFEQHKMDNAHLQKVAFINTKDTSDWQSFITNHKMNDWLNVRAAKGDTKYLTDLKVFTNPQFFLLNDKGVILLKMFNTDALTEILNKK